MNLYLIIKTEIDPASAWDSCIVAADTIGQALDWCELTKDDVDHITEIGTANAVVEPGIVLSQKDYPE